MSKLDKLLGFLGGLPSDVKIHVSRSQIPKLRTSPQRKGSKPNGLWYDCDKEWIDWIKDEMPNWVERYNYIYTVHLNKSNILELKTEEDVLNFTQEYGYQKGKSVNINELRKRLGYDDDLEYQGLYDALDGFSGMDIDWEKVASEYAGIEICPCQWDLRMDSRANWYYSWDIASGCIWNPAGISVNFIGFWDDEKEEIVSKDEIVSSRSSLSWYKKSKLNER